MVEDNLSIITCYPTALPYEHFLWGGIKKCIMWSPPVKHVFFLHFKITNCPILLDVCTLFAPFFYSLWCIWMIKKYNNNYKFIHIKSSYSTKFFELRILCQAVRRITNEILGVKGLRLIADHNNFSLNSASIWKCYH